MKTRFTTTMYKNSDGDRVPDLGGIESSNKYSISGDNASGGTEVLVAVTGTTTELDTARGATATTEVTDTEAEAWRAGYGLSPSGEHSDIPDVEIDEMLNTFTPADVLSAYEEDKVRVTHNFTQDLDTGEQRTVYGRYDVSDVEGLLYKLDAAELRDFVTEWGIGAIPTHLDTADVARSVIQNQTVGYQIMQDQEVTAISKIARAKGLNRASELTPNTRADMSGTLSDRARRLLMGSHADHTDMMNYLKGKTTTPPWDGDPNPPAKGSP